MRILLLSALLIQTLWGQSEPAHKCGFMMGGMQETQVTRAGERDIPQFDETLLNESIVSPAGHFRIHFTHSGTNAVEGPVSGTPPFVSEAAIAADSAYSVIVNDLGFLPPLPDEGIDGDELDIYIRNWNGTYYGMTYFGDSAPSITYLVVDNDYSESSYATSGLAALRVTIAHEFFHMVQLRYAHPFQPVSSNPYWYEISSTWMEEKCYPEIDDYHAYVADNFRQQNFPDLNDDSFGFSFSYGHCIFGQVLDAEFGTRNGKHIMLDIWENISGKEATDNLEDILSASPWNSSLTNVLGKYALYNVFTGSRAIPGLYYEDAALLPEIRVSEYDLPFIYPESFGFGLDNFEISFQKFNIPTLSDFYVSGENITDDQRVYLTYHSYEDGSSLKSAVGNHWLPCNNVSSQDYLIFPMVNGNREVGNSLSLNFEGGTLELDDEIQALWPNPGIPRVHPIQVSLMLETPGTYHVTVYDILGHSIFETSKFSPEGIRIIDLELPESTPSGLYILSITTKNGMMTRKFTVIR